jgi:hypothetical protein
MRLQWRLAAAATSVFVFFIRPARKLVESQERTNTQANANDNQDGQGSFHEHPLNCDRAHSIGGN